MEKTNVECMHLRFVGRHKRTEHKTAQAYGKLIEMSVYFI